MLSTPALWLSVAACCAGEIPLSKGFPEKVQKAAIVATVAIKTPQGSGTGVLVSTDGDRVFVLTARHVVADFDTVEVKIFSEASYPQPAISISAAKVLARTEKLPDLALLQFTTTEAVPTPLPLCPADDLPDEKTAALGVGCDFRAPTVLVDRLVSTRVIRFPDSLRTAKVWQLAEAHPAGRSGGPLVDASGRLIGICSGISREQSHFIHADEIRRFLKQNQVPELKRGK